MKPILKIMTLFCILMIAVTGSAKTANDQMPDEKQVNSFIGNLSVSEDFLNDTFESFIIAFPAGHCDIWDNGKISLYYYDHGHDAPKDYGSIYLDNAGKLVKPGCGGTATAVRSYAGENNLEAEKPVEAITENVTIQAVNNTSIPDIVNEIATPVVIIKNETGSITSQGNNNTISQLWINLADLKDCTINFFSGLGGHYTP